MGRTSFWHPVWHPTWDDEAGPGGMLESYSIRLGAEIRTQGYSQ